MEKPELTNFDSQPLSRIWEEWGTGLPMDLFNKYQEGYPELSVLSKEDLSSLADRALERALQDGAISFLQLSVFTVQQAGINLQELPSFTRASPETRGRLVESLSAWVASMSVFENPTPAETTDIPIAEPFSIRTKLDLLTRTERHPGLVKHAAASSICSGFLQLDQSRYIQVLDEKRNLATIVFLLTVFSADELLRLPVSPVVTSEPLQLALLWKLIRPPFSLEANHPGVAIGTVLDKIKDTWPATYRQVIGYFHNNALFATGFSLHLSRLTTAVDMAMALEPVPLEKSASAEAPPHPLFIHYKGLEPANLSLYLETIHAKWLAWCQNNIQDSTKSVYYLAASSFEESIHAYHNFCLSELELERGAAAQFKQLLSIDFQAFKDKITQNKTTVVMITRLYFIAEALKKNLFHSADLANHAASLLQNPIWTARHLNNTVNPESLRKVLEGFLEKDNSS
jgi:hypothetical protein